MELSAYKEELARRIDAWEGLKAEDFQYEPERAELKKQMQDWLADKIDADGKRLVIENRKFFAKCMAELVYEEKVRPHMQDFMH